MQEVPQNQSKTSPAVEQVQFVGTCKTCAFPHNFRFQVIAFFAGAVSFGHIVKASEPVVSSFLNFAFLGEAGVTQGKAIKRAFLCVRVDHALQNRYRSVFIPCKRPHSPADKKEQSFIQ